MAERSIILVQKEDDERERKGRLNLKHILRAEISSLLTNECER